MRVLFDTNILIDYLLGIEKARKEIQKYKTPRISIITWIEVMVGAKDEESDQYSTRSFLDMFTLVPLSKRIADLSVSIRKEYKIRLPDAIIWASAKEQESVLITRNSKDFSGNAPDIRIPYKI